MGIAVGIVFLSNMEVQLCLGLFLPLPISTFEKWD